MPKFDESLFKSQIVVLLSSIRYFNGGEIYGGRVKDADECVWCMGTRLGLVEICLGLIPV
mgnify:CR=1 FL=1